MEKGNRGMKKGEVEAGGENEVEPVPFNRRSRPPCKRRYPCTCTSANYYGKTGTKAPRYPPLAVRVQMYRTVSACMGGYTDVRACAGVFTVRRISSAMSSYWSE